MLEDESPKTKLSGDDIYRQIVDFKARIDRAKTMNEPWIETSKDVIDHFNQKGLNGANYFIYDNIRVFENGTMESSLAEEREKNTAHVPGHPGAIFEGRV